MAHKAGICSKHQNRHSPVEGCEDCKEEQRKQMKRLASSAVSRVK